MGVPATCVMKKLRSPASSGGPNCASEPVADCERQMVSPLAERISAYRPEPGVLSRVSSATVGASSTSRRLRSAASRNSMSSRKTVRPKNTTSTTSTDSISRRLSEGRDKSSSGFDPRRRLATRAAGYREAVAAPAQRLDGPQRFIRIELAAQSPDEHLDHVAVALVVLVVETLGQLGLRDDVTGAQHHVLEQPIFEGGEFDRRAVELHRLRARVEMDGSALEDGRRPATRAAHQRLHARQDFLEVIRLGDVVVGAGLQPFDLVLPAIARRQDQDREFLAAGAQLADELEARELGQAEIDDRDVERVFVAGVQAFFAVRGHVHRESLLRQ